MIFYLLSFLLAATSLLLESAKLKFPHKITYLILIALVLISIPKGNDYYNYIEVSEDENRINRIEPLSRYLLEISLQLGNIDIFFAAHYFIFLLFLFLFLKSTKVLNGISIFIIITFPLLYLKSFDLVRQYAAVSITSYAIYHLKNKKIIYFLILSSISYLFHKSSIAISFIALICNIINISNFKTKDIWLINLVTCIGIYIFSSYIIDYITTREITSFFYSHYFYKSTNNNGQKIYIFYLFFSTCCIFFNRYLTKNSFQINFHISFSMIGMFLYSFLINLGEHPARIFIYFTPSLIILFNQIQKNKKSIFLTTSLLLIGSFSYIYLIILKSNH